MSLASWSVESSRHTAVIDLNQGITYKIWCFLSWRREVVAPPSQGLRLAEHIGSSLFPLGSPVLPEAGWKLQRGGNART